MSQQPQWSQQSQQSQQSQWSQPSQPSHLSPGLLSPTVGPRLTLVPAEGPAADAIIGIDVSARWLECFYLATQQAWRVANTAAGWADLLARVTAAPPRLIVLEATGKHERGVTHALAAAGFPPLVAMPYRVRRFREGAGLRSKTDRSDARMLARYGQAFPDDLRALPSPALQELQDLVARRTQLVKQQTQEKNRRSSATGTALVASHDRALTWLAKELTQLDALLATRIAGVPAWARQAARLLTVPGLGIVTVTRIIAGLPELGTLTHKQLAALVGVAPYAEDSGQHRGYRHISGGRHTLRHALFYATVSVVRCDPTLKAHYHQLRAWGKSWKAAIIACLNKLLGILTAMERDALTWPETRVGQRASLPTAA
jgi:transposase